MSSWMVPGYADVRELGRGAVGRTVLARHAATGAQAVIRYLADGLAGDADARQRYRDLARALTGRDATRSSPPCTSMSRPTRDVALVREYVTGASLRVLLAAHGAMKPEAALTVLKGGLLGLAAAGRRARRLHPAQRTCRRGRPGPGLRRRAGARPSPVAAVTAADDLAAASAHLPRHPRR